MKNGYLLCLVYNAFNQFCGSLDWAWHKLVFCQHELDWVLRISIFKEREGLKITALPFATSNTINLFPNIVQIVLMRSLIYKLFK